MLPIVTIAKQDGATGVVRPSADGILVVIGASQNGNANTPSAFTRQDLAFNTFGYGPLVDCAGYDMAVANKPVVLIKGTTSTAGACGTVTNTNSGTASPVAAGAAYDDYDILVTFLAGGALGTAGITYTYSLDNGKTTSGVQALGVALSIVVPNTNATITLGTSTQTILAGQTVAFSTTAPRMTTADLGLALEALRTYAGGWDSILIASTYADSTTLGQIDTWLSTLEGTNGKFRTAVIGTTPRNAATQTEAQYNTAMSTAYGATSTTRVVVCSDQCYVTSPTRNIRQRRTTALPIASRGMAVDIARDCAYVADGPLSTVQLSDDRGNPLFHDEQLYPGLDDLRLASLRTFPALQGAYVNNPLLLSPSGSDYVFWQHARVMNKACELTVQALTNRLSQGIAKKSDGTIEEADAKEIEGLVNDLLTSQIVKPRRASACVFVLSRTDDLTSNQGATLNGEIQLQALAYVKKFSVVSHFVKTIRTPS